MIPPPIEVDDAGGGNLVGGLVVGAYQERWRGAPARYASRVIPPETFDGNGRTRAALARAVLALLEEFPLSAEVHLCTGDLLDETAARLSAAGRTVRRRAIVSTLQDLVEADFVAHLRALGLPPYVERLWSNGALEKEDAYRALNDFSANFVLLDPAGRGGICKKETRLWRRIAAESVASEEVVLAGSARRAQRLCCACGERVSRGPARRWRAGRKTFYTHVACNA